MCPLENNHPNLYLSEAEEAHAIKRGALTGFIGGACVDAAVDIFVLKGDLSVLDMVSNGIMVLGGIAAGIWADYAYQNEKARRNT